MCIKILSNLFLNILWDPVTHISGNEGEATKGIGGPSTFLRITHLFSSFLTSCQPLGIQYDCQS